ncbi:hypothetical protein HPP92_028551, partial [Vanilla planifolia]
LEPENIDALMALGIMDLQINEGEIGDFEKAGWYYMPSIKEINKPQEFALPFYGGMSRSKLKK